MEKNCQLIIIFLIAGKSICLFDITWKILDFYQKISWKKQPKTEIFMGKDISLSVAILVAPEITPGVELSSSLDFLFEMKDRSISVPLLFFSFIDFTWNTTIT